MGEALRKHETSPGIPNVPNFGGAEVRGKGTGGKKEGKEMGGGQKR